MAKGREPETPSLRPQAWEGGGVRAVSMATLPLVLREWSKRGRGGLTPPARPLPQPFSDRYGEDACQTANRL